MNMRNVGRPLNWIGSWDDTSTHVFSLASLALVYGYILAFDPFSSKNPRALVPLVRKV